MSTIKGFELTYADPYAADPDEILTDNYIYPSKEEAERAANEHKYDIVSIEYVEF